MLNAHLLIIDPQYDFMDNSDSALPVPGANADMDRLADMIRQIGPKLQDIHVTLDSHQMIDVAHPGMWRNANGDKPAPFTIITASDIEQGVWYPRNQAFKARLQDYANELERQGNYPLIIWPEHCLIGTKGHSVQKNLMGVLNEWAVQNFANIDFVTKGTNTFTEHYGALMAEVPDPQDPGTALNTSLLQVVESADIVAVAGEASSHCVMSTVNQIVDNIGEDQLKKFYLLTDCMSPVPKVGDGPDFPAIAGTWLKEMEAKGMVLTNSKEFLQ